MYSFGYHVSSIFHVPGSSSLQSLHLKKRSPPVSTTWLWERNNSLRPVKDPEAFLGLFYGEDKILFSPVGEFLGTYAFSPSCQARLGADSLPVAFPRVVLGAIFVWFLPLLQSAEDSTSHMKRLTSAPLWDVLRALAPGWRRLWVRLVECWGSLCVGQFRGSSGKVSPEAHGWTSYWSSKAV